MTIMRVGTVSNANVSNATGVLPPANGGTGIANNAASTVTISGNYALTATLTNTTSVTFPTSGTLVAGGAVTTSGLTQTTARILGRTTASTGAIEEITVGSGLSLAAGTLTATGGASKLVFLSAVTASSSATVSVETTFDSTYDEYLLIGNDILPDTDNKNLQMQMKIGGSYLGTGTYSYHITNLAASASTYSAFASTTDTKIILSNGTGNAANEGVNFVMTIYNPASAAASKQVTVNLTSIDAGGVLYSHNGAASNSGTAALTGLQFSYSTGNIASGTFYLYGIAKS